MIIDMKRDYLGFDALDKAANHLHNLGWRGSSLTLYVTKDTHECMVEQVRNNPRFIYNPNELPLRWITTREEKEEYQILSEEEKACYYWIDCWITEYRTQFGLMIIYDNDLLRDVWVALHCLPNTDTAVIVNDDGLEKVIIINIRRWSW